jgi:multiple sugar transport system substrate-binding protein
MNQMIFGYTKYPKAAKEFIRFMMEEEQYGAWLQAAIGYVAHPLVAYEKNPIWSSDPKAMPYRDAVKLLRPPGYAGKLGYASAGALADFIVVDMVAEAASGQRSSKEAAERAAKRAERYYKV